MTTQDPISPLGPLVLDYLLTEGYRPELETDGDGDSLLRFKVEGVRVSLYVYEGDRGFLSLSVDYVLPDPPVDARLLFEVANEVTMRMKLGKASVDLEGEGLRFQVDLLLEDPERFSRVLGRGLDLLLLTRNAFYDELRDRKKEA